MKDRLRLAVFRSNKAIYAQIIDDEKRKTLVAASEKELVKTNEKPATRGARKKTEGTEITGVQKTSKVEKARLVGKILAEKALKKGIKKVKFDRRSYKYHGRVKALAEAAREGGLEF